jgi:AraC family transcriptional regulator
MSEESLLQIGSRIESPRPTARLGNLVRSAMSFFETDRAAAWRCLSDASNLLDGESNESSSAPPVPVEPPRRGGLPKWRAKQALAYIETNLGSKIAIAEMADLLALSESHFYRAFKQTFGCSPMTYVAARRVERAKLMMTSTGERLSDIALACGFADQSHLTRYFRRAVGVSPGLWRRSVAAPTLPAIQRRNSPRFRPALHPV